MVDIQITGVRYQVSDKVRSYIEEKLGNLKRFHSSLTALLVTIHEEAKHGFRADVEMRLDNHEVMVAHDIAETIYAALDGVNDKCSKQLRRLHDKEQGRVRSHSDRQRIHA